MEGENFNHPKEICSAFHRAGRNTFGVFRGLKFEPDAEIGKNAISGWILINNVLMV